MILMHKNADIDALASALYLKEYFGNAVIASDGMDKTTKNVTRRFNLDIFQELPEDMEFEEIIAVDTASFEQLGKFATLPLDTVYDHHASNNMNVKKRVVYPEYPSCAEMLYRKMPYEVSRTVAFLLLCAIITDTLWFRHARRDTFQIFTEIMDKYRIEMNEIVEILDNNMSFGEKISVLKGFQRMKYRTVGDKIVCVTKTSANESLCATALLQFCNVVLVSSQRRDAVRITGRSRELDLLRVYRKISQEFGCTYGGHKKAAGLNCTGEQEAILNALMELVCEYFKGEKG